MALKNVWAYKYTPYAPLGWGGGYGYLESNAYLSPSQSVNKKVLSKKISIPKKVLSKKKKV